ncbi:hypothetical protein MKK52_20535, partial [Methylobacterium sp. J-067]|nr:hypothetical protein [Methylobacterium sp. J-067]
LALGSAANAASVHTVALGMNNVAGAAGAVAIGFNANASVGRSVALGDGAATSAGVTVSSVAIDGTTYGGFAGTPVAGVVSVGKAGDERQIQNVAA